ncbi:diacylglycerol/polyprenol kinase family protein [Leptolyngbya ohadii]|uniref:diacylglycerol/polyprenol kinase family protein n=1 Tax=Leptolyngbya ohadii TaxID=1962290 RepID=UPI001CED840D|nr:diacylglycerol/polyprenol kinase family protein [Leptolyngbya ohadii]
MSDSPLDSFADWIFETPALWLQLAIVSAWLGLVGLVAFGLSRWQGADNELIRKVVHIGAGNVILLAWWLHIPGWVGISASIVFSAVTLLSYRLPILPGINSVGRKSLGTFFYAVSIGVLIFLFWEDHPYYAAIGILVMTWGDGLAALVGQRLGWHPYELWGIKKSWEGSLTMAAVSYGVCSLILLGVQGGQWQTWTIAFVIAVVATLLEAFSRLGIDNLTVPLGSALLAFWLNQLL